MVRIRYRRRIFIGAGAIISSATLKKFSIFATGAVVIRDVESMLMVAGVLACEFGSGGGVPHYAGHQS